MSTKNRALAALVSGIAMVGSGVGTSWAQTPLSYHEAEERDRGVALERGGEVKLSSKQHVNRCLERDPDAKLVNRERLFLVVDSFTENLCSQFYVFATKGVNENLGACSFAFPLVPIDSSVKTKINKGASITRVIVDNRAILNPDDDPEARVPPTIHGRLDWVVDLKNKKGSIGKGSGDTYGELTLAGETALINDGSIKFRNPDNDILPNPIPEVDCDCGDGLFDADGGEVCDATDLDGVGCLDGQICNATCSLCLGDPIEDE